MADRTFWRHLWPFCVVKTVQWAGPFLTILCVYAFSWQVREEYPSFTFVLLFSWCAFAICLCSWLVHLFGLQRSTLSYGTRFVFPPVAMIDFGWALVCAFFYAIFGLIASSVLVKGIDTLKYPEVSLAGNYAIALLTVPFLPLHAFPLLRLSSTLHAAFRMRTSDSFHEFSLTETGCRSSTKSTMRPG